MNLFIESKLCAIRELTKEDYSNYQVLLTNEECFELQLRKAFTLDEIREHFLTILKCQSEEHSWFQEYAICSLNDNQLIGTIDCRLIDPEQQICIIGFLITPEHSNQGIMTDAVTCLTRHLLKNGVKKIGASTSALNKPAGKVLEKSSFKKEGFLRHSLYANNRYHDEVIFGLMLEDLNN